MNYSHAVLTFSGLCFLALCRVLMEKGLTAVNQGPSRRHPFYAAAEGLFLALPLIVFSVSAAAGGTFTSGFSAIGGGISFLFSFQFAPFAAFLPGIVLRRDFFDKGLPLLIASAMLFAFAAGGRFSYAEGAILLTLPFVCLAFSAPSEMPLRSPTPLGFELVLKNRSGIVQFLSGLLLLPIGAFFIYRFCLSGTDALDLSPTGGGVLGAFVILLPDLRLSLPELKKKERSLRLDRLLYSALFTVTLIPGTLAFLSPREALPDTAVLFTAAGALFPAFVACLPAIFTERISRFQGAVVSIFSILLLLLSLL